MPSVRSVAGLLAIACVFAVAGGYLDAYSYLAHGHVFATAQTGNVVLFSVSVSQGSWPQAWRSLPPIAGCILGVGTAQLLGVQSEKRTFRATLLCQAIELCALSGLAAFASHLPNSWVVPCISYVAALQNTSFAKLGPWKFNSVMTTSNIQNAVSGLALWLLGRQPAENRGRAAVSGLVFLSFFAGAAAGGVCTRRSEAHALLPSLAFVCLGLFLTWRQRQKQNS